MLYNSLYCSHCVMSRPQLREKMEDKCWRCLTQSQKRQLLHNNQQVLLLPKCLQIYFAKHDSNFRKVFRSLSTILATCLKRATGHSRPLFLTPSITLLHAILWGCIEFVIATFLSSLTGKALMFYLSSYKQICLIPDTAGKSFPKA